MFLLRDIEKSYGSTQVIRGMSCDIPTDKFVFIIGPSGSGKSTLLRLLSLVESPDRGTLTLSLDGVEYSAQGKARPWPTLTCVFQRQFLWPHLTLRENIRLPLSLVLSV